MSQRCISGLISPISISGKACSPPKLLGLDYDTEGVLMTMILNKPKYATVNQKENSDPSSHVHDVQQIRNQPEFYGLPNHTKHLM